MFRGKPGLTCSTTGLRPRVAVTPSRTVTSLDLTCRSMEKTGESKTYLCGGDQLYIFPQTIQTAQANSSEAQSLGPGGPFQSTQSNLSPACLTSTNKVCWFSVFILYFPFFVFFSSPVPSSKLSNIWTMITGWWFSISQLCIWHGFLSNFISSGSPFINWSTNFTHTKHKKLSCNYISYKDTIYTPFV